MDIILRVTTFNGITIKIRVKKIIDRFSKNYRDIVATLQIKFTSIFTLKTILNADNITNDEQ